MDTKLTSVELEVLLPPVRKPAQRQNGGKEWAKLIGGPRLQLASGPPQTPLFAMGTPAAAAAVPTYGPNDGMDIGAGRRMIEVGEQESQIAAHKSIKIIDIVYAVGAADPPNSPVMDMDMVCHIIAGEFKIQKAGIPAYTVKEGEIYTCGMGKTDNATNISNVVGIHRIALLIPA